MGRDLKNRVIAITGASAGIGSATAVECAKAGMKVAIAARRVDRLEAVAKEIESVGGEVLVVRCDVRRDGDVEDLFAKTNERFGRIDAVFANAGYGAFCEIHATPDELLRDMFETNFFGTVRCIKASLPYLREEHDGERGHFLICTSSCSEIGLPMYGYYAATKAAQDAIGTAMRAELSRDGVSVSTVHPIGTKTEFFDVVEAVSPPRNGRVGLNTPASLMHESQTVARAVVRCLRKPRPEVWPGLGGLGVRLGLAVSTAAPCLSAWAMRDMMRKRFRKKADSKSEG